MGIYYDQHRMIGAYVHGDLNSFYEFLKENGYTLTSEQIEELEEGGQWDDDIAEILDISDLLVVTINGIVGENFFIGFDLKLHKEDSKKANALKKIFKKHFPASEPQFDSFTSMI